jgi:hypothetical protein
MKLWWLSFVDPERADGGRFVGACLVEAEDFLGAVYAAHRRGCNPGGQVAGQDAPENVAAAIGPEWRNRLLSKLDIVKIEAEMAKKGFETGNALGGALS